MDYLALGFSTAISLVCGFGSISRLRRARIIEDTPSSKIRSAHQGYVELIGMAADSGDTALVSPLTLSPCVWYEYKIEEYRRSGKNSRWHTVQKGRSDAPFVIFDITGSCFIFPTGAEVSSHRKKTWQGSSRFPAGHQHSGFSLLSGKYRYTEELLCKDDPLYVIGAFSSRHPPNPVELANHAQANILNEWKQDYAKLLSRFDHDANGEIDFKEWELARAEALRKAERQIEQQLPVAVVHSIKDPKSRRHPFLIATTEPTALSRRFRWQAAGLFILSIIATAALTWQVFSSHGI